MTAFSGESLKIVAEELLDLSFKVGAKYCGPTPLVSPFWSTTFTPSSTEVYARALAVNNSNKDRIITTLQPCLRFVDFGCNGEDNHLLFFNMWSCFFQDALTDLNGSINDIFQIIEKVVRINRSEWYATYHPLSHDEINVNHGLIDVFGAQLLTDNGLNKDNCYPIHGTSTYLHKQRKTHKSQKNSTHLTGTPAEDVEGPRIELFANTFKGDIIEIATIVLFAGGLNLPDSGLINVPPSLAVAAGIERMALLRFQKDTLYDIDIFKWIYGNLSSNLPSESSHLIFKKELQSLISLITAESAIYLLSPDIPERSNFGPNKEKRRIHREIARLSSELGIPMNEIDNIKRKYLDAVEDINVSGFTRS